ncbi:MAG: AAA family ATPase [Defluviitaleaceae bacterium]|nr:AAA family ATPase [Defluviitaleaceae bacterium]
MLKKIYIHNYRCLVNFTFEFNKMNVFCGPNGSGKSSVFDALAFVRELAMGNCFLGDATSNRNAINQLEFCKWLDSDVQEFELEIAEGDLDFKYSLKLQQTAKHEPPRFYAESLHCNGISLFTRELQKVSFGENKSLALDWRQSAVVIFYAPQEMPQLEVFQQALLNLTILRPKVHLFENESKQETPHINSDFSNIISVYRHFAQDQEWTDVLRESLQEVWPEDFTSLKMSDRGFSTKLLELNFLGELYNFAILSDGEKMLVALYIIHAILSTAKVSTTIFIDEPGNFVTLQELQPWIVEMLGVIDNTKQLILISHNSEILNSAYSPIWYFYRDNHKSPTRVKLLQSWGGMTISEMVSRGWVEHEK